MNWKQKWPIFQGLVVITGLYKICKFGSEDWKNFRIFREYKNFVTFFIFESCALMGNFRAQVRFRGKKNEDEG